MKNKPVECDLFGPNMPLFGAVQIQTHTRCNFRCAFCPHGKIPIQHGEMSAETFDETVRQLGVLNFSGDIYPYLMNEPLMDSLLVERVASLRAACPNARIWIDTNASLATSETLFDLVRAGADVVNLEIYLPRSRSIPQKIKRLHAAIPDKERQHVFIYERASDAVLTNRAGNLPGRPVPPKPFSLPCERPFRQIYIAYDGSLLLCCQDYRREAILGNLHDDSLEDIWRGAAYRHVRKALIRSDRGIPLCERCDYSGRMGDMPEVFRKRIPLPRRLRWQFAWSLASMREIFGNRMFVRYLRSWFRRRVFGGMARV